MTTMLVTDIQQRMQKQPDAVENSLRCQSKPCLGEWQSWRKWNAILLTSLAIASVVHAQEVSMCLSLCEAESKTCRRQAGNSAALYSEIAQRNVAKDYNYSAPDLMREKNTVRSRVQADALALCQDARSRCKADCLSLSVNPDGEKALPPSTKP